MCLGVCGRGDSPAGGCRELLREIGNRLPDRSTTTIKFKSRWRVARDHTFNSMVRFGILGFGLHAVKRLMPGFALAQNCRVTGLSRRTPRQSTRFRPAVQHPAGV
jgi:hypothetical protein